MKELKPSQLKALSEFLNTIAAAWFSAGIISPIFVKPENFPTTLVLALVAIIAALSFLALSLYFVRKVKL